MNFLKLLWRGAMFAKQGRGIGGKLHLLWTAPKQVALIGRLLRDNRVPPIAKAVLVGAGMFAVSPLNVPGWIPVLGTFDDLGIALLAINLFLRLIPEDLVLSHKRAVGLAPKFARARR